MDILSELLNNISTNFTNEIFQFYERFYSYTLDLINHKNIDFDKEIVKGDKEISILINSINSALNTTGIPITELSNQATLKDSFRDAFNAGESNFKNLFDKAGRDFINRHLFKSILEYLLDIDSIKIENLDLFDLLPLNFKDKLDEFKKNLSISDDDKRKMKSLISTITNNFDVSTLKFTHVQANESEVGTEILQKLHEAKERNIQTLKNPQMQKIPIATFASQETIPDIEKSFYFDYFGNFPSLNSKKAQSIKIDLNQFSEIVSNMDLFMDLENLFYFISILKMYGLKDLLGYEKTITILRNFIKGSIFSSGMYHISNPISNFYGLSILSELNILKEENSDLVDFLDIEMFLESEIKNFIPSKFLLNYYTLLSLKILERHNITIMDKSRLLNSQLSLNFSNIDPKDLPRDILYHLTLIKLIDKNYQINNGFLNYNFDGLLSPNGLINNNVTDSSRVLLILDLVNQKDKDFSKRLINSILSNFEAFFEIYPQFNWKTDIVALKTELRLLFWFSLAMLRY